MLLEEQGRLFDESGILQVGKSKVVTRLGSTVQATGWSLRALHNKELAVDRFAVKSSGRAVEATERAPG